MNGHEKARVGLVGAGYVSVYHARALRSLPFVEIVGIADPDEARAKAIAAQFQIPRVFNSLAAMADVQPQVIHVLTPPALHADIAVQAIEMGCHVLVEKPMAETVADCDRMMAKARERGAILSVNHSARLDPVVLEALDRIRAGACGQILGADFFRSSDYAAYSGGPHVPPQFRKGSYPFQDLGVHALYLLEAFLGAIQRADIRYYPSGVGDPNLVFDEWRGLVECERGVGHMYLSWNVRPIQNELIIHGTRGVMTVDCYLQTITLRKTYPAPKAIQRIMGAGLNSLSTLAKVTANTLRFATGRLKPSPGIHVSVVKFHEALHKGEPPPVPASEGRRIIGLLEGVSFSADEDKQRYLTEEQPAVAPKILVTGAGGFLGGALVRRLQQSREPLRLWMRRPPRTPIPHPNHHVIYGDLGNPEIAERALEGIDTVYHVGAAMRGGPFEFQSGTVWGARNIVDACRRHRVHKLVYVSSLSVLDHAHHKPGVPVTETSPYEPHPDLRGLYTQTKLEAEKIVLDAAAKGEVNAVILRFGQIYGRGAEKVPPSGTIALAGRWLVVGNGRRMVPLVHVENCVDALLQAARKNVPNGSIFQVVDPDGISQRDYIEWVRRSGRPVKPLYVPTWMFYCMSVGVGLLGRILKRSVPLTPYRVRSIRPLWPCDTSAARKQLGWQAKVSVAEGMERTFGKGETSV